MLRLLKRGSKNAIAGHSQLRSLKEIYKDEAQLPPQHIAGPMTSPLGCVRFHWSLQSLPTQRHWTMSLLSHPGTPTRNRSVTAAALAAGACRWQCAITVLGLRLLAVKSFELQCKRNHEIFPDLSPRAFGWDRGNSEFRDSGIRESQIRPGSGDSGLPSEIPPIGPGPPAGSAGTSTPSP
jgi:hypothetical protein